MTENQPSVSNKPEKMTPEDRRHKILTIVGIVLCVILVPVLIVNCTLLVKSWTNQDDVPDFGGIIPLIVLTDSMYPDIKSGDLIICRTIDTDKIEVEDVISFYDPASTSGTAVVTHQVIEIYEEDGVRYFRTKGVNNNTEDRLAVEESKVIAKYTGVRFPGLGSVAIFMQTTPGLLVCVGLPVIALVGYDFLRRRKYEKEKGQDVAALMAELEALKAAQAQKEENSEE